MPCRPKKTGTVLAHERAAATARGPVAARAETSKAAKARPRIAERHLIVVMAGPPRGAQPTRYFARTTRIESLDGAIDKPQFLDPPGHRVQAGKRGSCPV